MQLKLTRTQREGGLLAKSVIFCLDARVQFTPAEQADLQRYRLLNQVIYNSDAQTRAAEGSALAAANARAQSVSINSVDDFLSSSTAKIGHGLKAIALGAASVMRLTITINSLANGQHIECKDLDELIGAENAIMQACQNLRGYLETAAAFNGGAVVYEITENGPLLVSHAAASAQAVTAALPPLPELSSLSPTLAPAIPALTYDGSTTAVPANDPYPSAGVDPEPQYYGEYKPRLDLLNEWDKLAPEMRAAVIVVVVFVLIILLKIIF